MRKIFQNRQGGCFAACIASVLDLPLNAVPDFFDGQLVGSEVTSETRKAIQNWFGFYGLYYFWFGFRSDLRTTLTGMAIHHPGPHYLLVGLCRGSAHAVVARGDKIVHDPANENGGPVPLTPLPDGHLRVGIIGKNL